MHSKFHKSIGLGKQMTQNQQSNSHQYQNDQQNQINPNHQWANEKHIQNPEQLFDGIEIFLNDNDDGNDNQQHIQGGLGLMHVMGTKCTSKHNVMVPLTIGSGSFSVVSYKQMNSSYHPVCDFDTVHRVPVTYTKDNRNQELTKAQKLTLLGDYEICNEETATRDEMTKTLIEMRNLENDRLRIKSQINGDKRIVGHKCCIPTCEECSNIDDMLDQVHVVSKFNSKKKSSEFKDFLQRKRGGYFHASFNEKSHRNAFVKHCGGTRSDKTVHPSLNDYVDVAASAASIRHVAITKSDNGGTSFFLSKDDGGLYWDECLPKRLATKIRNEINQSEDGSLRYLACGPNESHYAKFTSGKSLWSVSAIDEELRNVMNTFDVQRVAFGSFGTSPSWIVIGENGKVAWRNLPSRLHAQLSKRTEDMAAPCEVSLGEHGSYFIRYLDGENDYCLPAHIADSCEEIVKQGAEITNIALHPESSDAFIIRHTQLP